MKIEELKEKLLDLQKEEIFKSSKEENDITRAYSMGKVDGLKDAVRLLNILDD